MNYIVKYYGHSAYSVETDNHFLLFDYVGDLVVNYNNETYHINQSQIDFSKINKPITMFHSHTHFDHYNPILHKTLSKNNNIFTIVGEKTCKLNNSTYLFGGDSININGIQITTENSTDIGVCYLINVDGITIYYAGDNIDWGDSAKTSKNYIKYINNLSQISKGYIDVAFVPVCNFYGFSYSPLTESAIYACKQLNAKEIYPMHSPNGTRPYIYFKQHCEMYNLDLNIKIINQE